VNSKRGSSGRYLPKGPPVSATGLIDTTSKRSCGSIGGLPAGAAGCWPAANTGSIAPVTTGTVSNSAAASRLYP
jgi:hypothetical protein